MPRCLLLPLILLPFVAQAADREASNALRVFDPLADPSPPDVARRAWPSGPLDRFVLARLEAADIPPAPRAAKRELIRRATFDLLGLPPEADEIEDFLAEDSPDAFSRLVDRLLASPHYGERWGRHWLDVVRYADSNGLDENVAHGNAWRYRDYVVASFNRAKPYGLFLQEQIAGDILPPVDDRETMRERLVATGFLSLGPKVLAEGDLVKLEMDIIDEQIDTLGKSVLGLTLGCARCHDHKFDPIATEDYYALAGIFKSTRTMESLKRIARWHENSLATDEQLARRKAHDERVAATKKELEAAKKAGGGERVAALEKEIAELEKTAPELPSAMGVTRGDPTDVRVHVRGDHLSLGDSVPRGVPASFPGAARSGIGDGDSGRLALACWATAGAGRRASSRVMVNRIWRWHLGQGIVRSTENFGFLGEKPTHPELLDWLASRFVDEHWAVKRTHRRILLSSTYRQSSRAAPSGAAQGGSNDPENRLLWRFRLRRLEAEEIRDSVLAASGLLDARMGGTLLLHVKNREFLFDHTSKDTTSYDFVRRSIYLPVIRNNVCDALSIFDFPDPAVPNGDRRATTVPSQALFLMNSEFIGKAADALASRVSRLSPATESRVEALYRFVFGRPPTDSESARARTLLDALRGDPGGDDPLALATLAQALLCSNEFMHVR